MDERQPEGSVGSRSRDRGSHPLERRVVPALVVGVVLVWGSAVGFEKIRNYDYWWHLATGQHIVETGSVPRTDPFTYTVEGARWIDLHWLFQLGLQSVHALAGHEGVRLAKGLLVWVVMAAAAWAAWRRERAAVLGLGLVGLAVLGSTRFLARPDLPSFALLSVVMGLLFRHESRGGWWVLAVVPIQVLWANLHGLFAVGLAVIAMALWAEALRPGLVRGVAWRRDRLVPLAVVLALSAAGALLNPNGFAGATFPLVQLGMIGTWDDRGLFGQAINELRPTLELGAGVLAPFFAMATLVGVGFVANRRRLEALDVLLFVAFLYLALTARRNLALFAVVAVPLLVRNLGAVWEGRVAPGRRARLTTAWLVLLCVSGAAFAASQLRWAWHDEGMTSSALMPARYPERAVDWIERERPPGPIYHRMPDGGYLIARLFPAYRAMVDGRLEVFGPTRFAALETGGRAGFDLLDARYGFGTVLLHHAFFAREDLLAALWQRPEWQLVQLDESAAVFVRHGEESARRWPVLDPGAPDLFPPLDPRARPGLDLWRRHARVRLLATLGAYARALALADETLALHRSPAVSELRDWLRARAPLGG